MNEPTTASRPALPAWKRQVAAFLVFLAVLAYGGFLWWHVSPHAGGSDPSGYFNSARLLSQGRLLAPARVPDGHHPADFGSYATVPLGFIPRAEDRLAPTYPTGYPLHLVVASVFRWKHAAQVANVLLALASGLLLFGHARRLGFGCGLAIGGVVLLWLCPLFLFAAMMPMSDLPALAWTLAALYCALEARDSWRWGLLCGFAVGAAVLVRPANLLLAVPVAAAVGIRPRSWLAIVAGGLPAAVFLVLYNRAIYGSPLTTGYGDVSASFSAAFVPPNLAAFARWIPILLSPLVLVALAGPFIAAVRQRGFVVLILWAVTLVGFYVFYYHTGETWWYLRFILPAFPALILAMLAVFDALRRAGGSRPRLAAGILACLVAAVALWQVRQLRPLGVLYLEEGERIYPEAARWAKRELPARSAIFCMQVSGAFFYYTDFLLLRWDLVEQERLPQLYAALREDKRPVYAVLYEFEQKEALARIGGRWRLVAVIHNATVWQLAAGPAQP
ncbi:MAG: glycosyltransferase family 39 protein [Opitutae bacterium]|nr:glycosyltransferase family 39 protein [Opitutae bacterium]